MSMQDIDKLTAQYAEAYDNLSDLITAMQDEQSEISRRHMPKIKKAVNALAAKEAALKAAVDADRSLFGKPRTQVMHGFKVGLQKMIGRVKWTNAKAVVAKLMEHVPNWKKYCIVEYKPGADALKDLPAADLKRLGVTVENTSDTVIIRPVASDIEKLVNAFLKEKGEELEREAA